MILPIDQILFPGICYILTIISTLRATSRLQYMLRNNGTIGLLDGPYIEPPNDADTNITTATTSSFSVNDVRLWEAVYTFQEAVRLKEDDSYAEEGEVFEDEDASTRFDSTTIPYSLSPYSTYSSSSAFKQENNDPTVPTENVTNGVASASASATGKIHAWYNILPPLLPSISYKSIKQTLTLSLLYPIKQANKLLQKSRHTNNNEDDYLLPPRQFYPYTMKRTKKITLPHTNHTARVTSYAIPIFRELRSKFLSLDAKTTQTESEEYFLHKMTKEGPFKSFSTNSKGAARAGLIFFFSKDGAYLIKQVKKSEAQLLLSILPKYHKYMKQYWNKSLLTRFFGLYHVHMNDPHSENEYFFIVMNSIFPVASHGTHDFITERFDLKGSTVGRECSLEERAKKGAKAILKDLDLLHESETKEPPTLRQGSSTKQAHTQSNGFQFGAVAKSSLLFQLRKDIRFLLDCNVIDYSLLVGIVPLADTTNPCFRRFSKPTSSDSLSSSTNTLHGENEIMLLDNHDAVLGQKLFSSLLYSFQIVTSPSVYLLKQVITFIEKPLASLLSSSSTTTIPKIPYYNAEQPSINGGKYSLLYGKRNNQRALYYLGIIDFLQPWTFTKKVEHEIKGIVLGHEKKSKISCVPPKEYADRFINFMEGNIT